MFLEEVTCSLATNKTGYIIEGFAGISASQSIAVKITAENPPVATSYKVQVFSYSTTYNAMIDEAYDEITIQNNCKLHFKIHSLR